MAVTRKTLHIPQHPPGARLARGQRLSRMGYQKVTDRTEEASTNAGSRTSTGRQEEWAKNERNLGRKPAVRSSKQTTNELERVALAARTLRRERLKTFGGMIVGVSLAFASQSLAVAQQMPPWGRALRDLRPLRSRWSRPLGHSTEGGPRRQHMGRGRPQEGSQKRGTTTNAEAGSASQYLAQ